MADNIIQGKVVTLTYSIVGADGKVVEQNDVPVRYIHGGRGDLLPKLEQALEGHVAGDIIPVPISPDEGFGRHDPNMTFTDDLENVPPEFHQLGAEAEFQNEQGERKVFTVSKIEDGKLTLDGNHPLAGKSLTFHLRVTEVRDASDQELKTGTPDQPHDLGLVNQQPTGRQ